MPKLKTLKSAVKRFKKISSGTFKRKKANLRHLLTKKKKSYKRNIRDKVLVSNADLRKVSYFLPYS